MIREYQERFGFYEAFASLIASLIKAFLSDARIRYYATQSRAKSPESLRDKIERRRARGEPCARIRDITDLAGVQVILYFSDDVSRVISLLDNEFDCVEEGRKEAARAIHSTIRGYDAAHKLVRLAPKRVRLSEYQRFEDLLCEVQIKTILQQAWSEIEHDIGYKPKVKESDLERSEIRRLFKHNARLLKKVDDNFVAIRTRHRAILDHYGQIIERRKLRSLAVNFETVHAYLYKELGEKTVPRSLVTRILELSRTLRLKNLLQLEGHLSETDYLREYYD